MKEIYLIRHGESEYNAAEGVYNKRDPPLTQKGIDQV